jgi:hypothetical protein
MFESHRRHEPRVLVDAIALEMDDQLYRDARVIDLSESGLRIARLSPTWHSRVVQLEFEIPEVGETMWASGELRFDAAGPGDITKSGIRLLAAANRHKKMLREYVNDTWESPEFLERDWLRHASCYFRS